MLTPARHSLDDEITARSGKGDCQAVTQKSILTTSIQGTLPGADPLLTPSIEDELFIVEPERCPFFVHIPHSGDP